MHNRIEEMAIPGDGVFIMKGCEKRGSMDKDFKGKSFSFDYALISRD